MENGASSEQPVEEVHLLPKTLGDWITELRLAKRKVASTTGPAGRSRPIVRSWARSDLASLASLAEPTLFRIETNAEFPRFDVLESILRALDVYTWQAQVMRDMWFARTTGAAPARRSDDKLLREPAIRLLDDIPFPAYVLDGLYYVKARNRYMLPVVGLTPDDSGLWENPNGILLAFHPTQSLSWFEPDTSARAWRLQQFLLDTARYSVEPDYEPLLNDLERFLNGFHRGWHTYLHLGELASPPGQRAIYRHPQVGPLEFLVCDQLLELGHPHKIRVFIPSAGSRQAFDRARELADQDNAPVYICPAWRDNRV